MPRRKTLEEVKQEIYELSDGKTEILSDEYINVKTPLLVKCECGNIFYRDYGHLKRGQLLCTKCSKEKQSKLFRANFDDVIQYIEEHGCKYISGEYVNNNSLLTLQCSCGNIFQKSMTKFKNAGQDHCSECGFKNLSKQKTKYTTEDAKNIFSSGGYMMIGEYINANTLVECICKNGHHCLMHLSEYIFRGRGCQQCVRDKMRGENHPNFKGGVSIIEDRIRHQLSDWKKQIRSLFSNKCPITGEFGLDCDVHHLTSLSIIFSSICDKYNINITKRDNIKELESYELFDTIVNEIISAHNSSVGILISKDIHVQFHKEYGYGNNTPQQFNQFLIDHYSTTLEEIQSKHLLSKTA